MLLPQFLRSRAITMPTGLRSVHLAVAAAMLVGSVSCGSDDNTTTAPVVATKPVLKLSDNVVTIVRGSASVTKQITATVDGSPTTAITWSSTRPDIATISSSGLITAVADGSTFFTATLTSDPTVNASVVVNVVSTIITASANSLFSWVGGPTRTATATIQNNSNTAVTWSSSNTAVATVSSTGVITPVAAGTASIIATSVGDATKQSALNFTVDAAPGNETLITSGQAVTGLGGADGVQTFYRIVVPVGATALTVATTGGTGDVDIFVRAGVRPPSVQSYTSQAGFSCFSAGANTVETCTITNPQARIYYIMVDSFGFSGTTMTATITP